MSVDKQKGIVTYRIPHPSGKWINYEEKIFEGINDDPQKLSQLKKLPT